MTRALDDSLTFADLFCGAGGSSTGLVRAGFDLKLAANHWATAIETHAANHPDADHWCADINQVDMRRLPRTRVLWASPICTEISPAGGRRRRAKGQLEMFGHVESAAFERTRATALDVIRATEVHRYDAVLCENVVEFATDWEMFDWWLGGMTLLGYEHQIVSASSAHLGDDPAPQWRDRVYIVFTRRGIPKPNLEVRPWAWCPPCGRDVQAVQAWRGSKRIGKYRQQYDYRCSERACGHSIVEPYVRPAAAIIDWANTGQRIGDRTRPLAPKTMARIQAGLDMFPTDRTVLTVNHDGHDGRIIPADRAPLPSRTAKIGDGVLMPPFVIEYRKHGEAHAVSEPLSTVTAGGNHHGLVSPFLVKNYGGNCTPENNVTPISDPIATVTANDHHSLVIPYRAGTLPTLTDRPMLTVSTHDSAALVHRRPTIDDCWFRMIQPREQLYAQAFPRSYIVHGNKGEQTMQAGNSVSVNAAQWIGERVAAALDGVA